MRPGATWLGLWGPEEQGDLGGFICNEAGAWREGQSGRQTAIDAVLSLTSETSELWGWSLASFGWCQFRAQRTRCVWDEPNLKASHVHWVRGSEA